jgi:hypothetical protein
LKARAESGAIERGRDRIELTDPVDESTVMGSFAACEIAAPATGTRYRLTGLGTSLGIDARDDPGNRQQLGFGRHV